MRQVIDLGYAVAIVHTDRTNTVLSLMTPGTDEFCAEAAVARMSAERLAGLIDALKKAYVSVAKDELKISVRP